MEAAGGLIEVKMVASALSPPPSQLFSPTSVRRHSLQCLHPSLPLEASVRWLKWTVLIFQFYFYSFKVKIQNDLYQNLITLERNCFFSEQALSWAHNAKND